MLIHTEDDEYIFVIDDHNDTRNKKPQWVVYKGDHVVIDRHGWEATHGTTPVTPPGPRPPDPSPDPPVHSVGGAPVIPVTTAEDGPFAPRMMSDRANAWVSGDHAFVFGGSRATGGPLFFQVDLRSEQVVPLGPKMDYVGETEGWLTLPDGRVVLPDGPRLRRLNVFTSEDVIVGDISVTHPGCDLWQPHASDDGQTFSATVRQLVSSGKYPYIGTVVFRQGQPELYLPAIGTLDESQISRDGQWIVIKETPEGAKEGDNDNRVISLATRETRTIRDQERALGHSDCGPDFIVGEADKPDPGACVIRYLDRLHEAPTILFHTLDMGYVSTRGGRCLWSGPTHLSLVALDGSGVTPLLEHVGGSAYDDRLKANLSPCGRVATYMLNGSVYLLVLP